MQNFIKLSAAVHMSYRVDNLTERENKKKSGKNNTAVATAPQHNLPIGLYTFTGSRFQ